MVIIVLLKDAFTCATPEVMFFFSRRRTRGEAAAALVTMGLIDTRALNRLTSGGLLLAGDRPRLALAGAGVGVGALAADRQVLAVPEAPVAAEIHQPLDVHRHFAAQIAFDPVVAVDRLADAYDLVVGELADAPLGRNADLPADLLGL